MVGKSFLLNHILFTEQENYKMTSTSSKSWVFRLNYSVIVIVHQVERGVIS